MTRWLLHWLIQSVKLMFYTFFSAFCCIPVGIFQHLLDKIYPDDNQQFSLFLWHAGNCVLILFGIAIFTATFAHQLREFELEPFKHKKKIADQPLATSDG